MTTVLCYVFQIIKNSGITKRPHKPVRTPYFAKKSFNCSTLGFTIAHCEPAAEKKLFKPETLTHEQCIKQACLQSVNSATTLLTTTSAALLDVCDNYKDSLNRILGLLEKLQTVEGEHPELWDEIVEARVNVNDIKASLTELHSYMESVEKVVTSTTEAAFLAGAEYMTTVLCERLHSVQTEICNRISELKKLEDDYMKVQGEVVACMEKPAKNKGKNSEMVKVKIDTSQLLKQ